MALDPRNVVKSQIHLSRGTPWPVAAEAWDALAREALELAHAGARSVAALDRSFVV